ncbi:MAG: hypothetical protein R3F43_28535 [bacterium]
MLKAGDVIGEAELLRRSDFTETVESVTSMISFTLTWEALTLVMEDIPGGLERVRQRLEDREAGRWPPPPRRPATRWRSWARPSCWTWWRSGGPRRGR